MDLKKFNKTFKVKNIKNNVFYNGENLRIFRYKKRNKNAITRKEMYEIVQQLQNEYKEIYKDGYISVSIRYPDRYYSGQVFNLNDDINIFSMNDYNNFDEDPDEYQEFRFHFIPIVSEDSGGSSNDENNDCLYNSLIKFIQTKHKITPEGLKAYLKLERQDKIPISMMDKVEEYINREIFNQYNHKSVEYSIYVSGDYEYVSKKSTNKRIHIILSNGHYKADRNKLIKPKCLAYEDKLILMYEIVEDKIISFDGKKKKEISQEKFKNIMSNPITSDYILVDKNFIPKVEGQKLRDLTIEECYKNYINMADSWKELYKKGSKFKLYQMQVYINFYRCGSIKNMALNTFYLLNQCITSQAEHVNKIEASYIENATYSALTYWENYKGNVHSVDVNSLYPTILKNNSYYYPIKEGEYKTLSNDDLQKMINEYIKKKNNSIENKKEIERLEDIKTKIKTTEHLRYNKIIESLEQENKNLKIKSILKNGIYNCIIEKPNKKCKFFMFNKKNFYTHIDLEIAILYGFKITMIEKENNFLYYSENCLMNGAALFKNYVEPLYEQKNEKTVGAKELLNTLWGALCEYNIYNRTADYEDKIELSGCEIKKIHSDTENIKTEYLPYIRNTYKTKYARIKPFLLAYARAYMFHNYRKYEDLVIRIHTDGMFLKELPEDLLDNNIDREGNPKIGYLKYEGNKQINLTGLNTGLKINLKKIYKNIFSSIY